MTAPVVHSFNKGETIFGIQLPVAYSTVPAAYTSLLGKPVSGSSPVSASGGTFFCQVEVAGIHNLNFDISASCASPGFTPTASLLSSDGAIRIVTVTGSAISTAASFQTIAISNLNGAELARLEFNLPLSSSASFALADARGL